MSSDRFVLMAYVEIGNDYRLQLKLINNSINIYKNMPNTHNITANRVTSMEQVFRILLFPVFYVYI